jgi:hypothetical protein
LGKKKLYKRFSNQIILALAENETVDAFGLSLIENGKRVRASSGCDGESHYEFGEPLILEIIYN